MFAKAIEKAKSAVAGLMVATAMTGAPVGAMVHDAIASHAAQSESAYRTVVSVEREQKTMPVYNLEVRGAHTFFVGEEGVLAHNGVVYCRIMESPLTPEDAKPYFGKADNKDRNYPQRQSAQRNANPGKTFIFTIFYEGPETGRALEKIEQGYIDGSGGPTNKSNPGGGTQNKRNNFRKPKKPKSPCGC